MAKLVIFLFLFKLCLSEFVCPPKCDCNQENEKLEYMPLFNINCARLDLGQSPEKTTLPVFMGRLDVSHNNIEKLNESSTLNSSTLYFYDLSHNNIYSIADKYFQNLTSLIHINLSHNKLTSVNQSMFYGLTNLKTLNLKSNMITVLPKQIFSNLSSLEELNLSNNKLGQFLINIKLSDYLPSLIMSLYLNHINLKKVSREMFEDMDLKRLSVAYNSFSELPYIGLDNLEYLDISGTKVINVTTKSFMYPYLKVLKMNRLPIKKINDYTFFNLHKLEELYIEHCIKLEEMDPVSFGYLQGKDSPNHLTLKKFSVAYSGLKFLPDTFKFIFQDLEEIHLRGNFWDCSCRVMWLRNVRENVKDIDEIRCWSPESNSNKTIFAMQDEEFSCLKTKKFMLPPGAPMKSWLFPLIGVLSIIILLLVAALVYMGPYGQNIYKMEGKMIGPDSPYSAISIEPNQAENLKV